MDDALLVRGRKPARDLHGVRRPPCAPAAARRPADRAASRPSSSSETMNGAPSLGADVVDREDVRMVQRRGRACFLLEAAQPIGIGRERRRQHLDRDVTPEPRCRARDTPRPSRPRRAARGSRTGRGARRQLEAMATRFLPARAARACQTLVERPISAGVDQFRIQLSSTVNGGVLSPMPPAPSVPTICTDRVWCLASLRFGPVGAHS